MMLSQESITARIRARIWSKVGAVRTSSLVMLVRFWILAGMGRRGLMKVWDTVGFDSGLNLDSAELDDAVDEVGGRFL